ncbi:DUF4363 family protein [Clostridium thailandense]|nr:DUF4363 family protein [Clostridium thailandense]
MKKIIAYSIPAIILGFFILIMTTGQFLKKPMREGEDVVKYISIIQEDVKAENWNYAEQDRQKLMIAWGKIVPRIQFSVERDEIYNININLARLGGIIMGKDQAGALAELGEIYENWRELGR